MISVYHGTIYLASYLINTVLVCKKLAKGKSFSQIADDCELTEEETLPFYSVAQRYAPDYNVDQIFTEYWTQKYPDISKLEDIINIGI